MEFAIHEVVPKRNCNRSAMGRVVVNPPSVMGPMTWRTTAKIFMCCNRAYLTEDSFKKHMGEKKDHGKALDFSKLPPPHVKEERKEVVSKDYDSTNRNLWIVRKVGREIFKKADGNGVETEMTSDFQTDSLEPMLPISDNSETKHRRDKKCHLCGIETTYTNFNRHIKTCHVPEGVKCDYCPCTFLLHTSRLRHHNIVHGIRIRNRSTANFKQAIVSRAKKQLFSSAAVVTTQIKKGQRSYRCNICKKEFSCPAHLSDHKNSHTGSRPYKCDICGVRFSHNSNLGRHKQKAHSMEDKFFCKICKCGFSANCHLLRHNKTMHPKKLKIRRLPSPKPKISGSTDSKKITGSRPGVEMPSIDVGCPPRNASGRYKCHVCQKELTSAQAWRGHMLIHQNLKPYKCQYCGVEFRLHSTRSQHIMKIHTGGKFKCKDCTCSFETLSALKRHTTKHSHTESKTEKNKTVSKENAIEKKGEESPLKNENVAGFKCNLCGTIVRLIEDFEEHKILHDGSRSTQCNLCLKEFGSNVNVKIHKKRAHGDASISVHKCAFCCCRYTTSQALFKHLVMEHEMDRDDWNYKEKSLKSEARRRIQLKLLSGYKKQETGKLKTGSTKTFVLQKCEKKGNEGDAIDKDTSKGHECDICHKRFASFKKVGLHKMIAHNFGTYPCGLCPCRYQKKSWLEKHQIKEHGGLSSHTETKSPDVVSPDEGKNVCSFCKFEFSTSKGLAAHQRKSNCRSGNFKCKKCPCKFKMMRGLTMHMRRHRRRVGTKRTPVVDKVHIDEPDHEEQARTQMDTESIMEHSDSEKVGDGQSSEIAPVKPKNKECNICHNKFAYRSVLSRHMKVSHFHSGKFKCLECPCKFVNEKGLLNHKKYYHKAGDKTIQKPANFRRTKKIEDLKKSSEVEESKDENQDTPVDPTKIRCEHCDLMIHPRSHHVETSHGSGSHSCSECTCVFTTARGLNRHENVYHKHKEIRSLSNNLDNGDDGEEGNVQTEELTPRSPSKVNLNFLKIRSSSSHKRRSSRNSASPVKNSNAPVQSSSSKDKSEIYPSNSPRLSTSTIIYKFKCNLCGIKFSNSSYFSRHQQKAHVEGGTPCDSCSCSFSNIGSLGAHKRVYHGGDSVVSMRKSLKKPTKTRKSSSVVAPTAATANERQSRDVHDEVGESNSNNDSKKEAVPEVSDSTEYKTRHSARSKLSSSGSSENKFQQHSGESNPDNLSLQSTTQGIPCTWCSKAFPTNKALEKHILSHTRPEICQQCGMRFRNREEVVKHAKMLHDKRLTHECPVCTCRFATIMGLKSHHNKIHQKQSASYNNIVIEHDEGPAIIDNEPFIDVGSSYNQENTEDDFCEDSEPIVQGILETNYSPNGDYDHQESFQDAIPDQEEEMEVDDDSEPILEGILETNYSPNEDYDHQESFQDAIPDQEEEMEVDDDSEPILQGILEYSESGVTYHPPSPIKVENKKSFSPKFRPIKCSTCGTTCYGPEKLRFHMQSHHQGNEGDDAKEPADDVDIDNVVRKCEKCDYEFQSSSELAQHMQLEHDESGLYRCAYCSCTMKTETNLRSHFMKYHSG